MDTSKVLANYIDSGIESIGIIPSSWKIGKLKYVANISMGQSPNSESYNHEAKGLPFLQGNADFGTKSPSPTIYSHSPKRISNIDDILLSVRAPVGALNISDQRYAIGRGLCAITPIKIIAGYLWYYLLFIRIEFLSKIKGSTFESISTDDVKNTVCLFPSLKEQKQIADFLDHKTSEIDDLIADKERLIDLLEEKRQAVITEVVTKGLNPEAEMKDSGVEWIGEIPEHWGLIRNKYLFARTKKIVNEESENYKVLSLTKKGVIERDIESNIGKMPASFDGYQVIRPDDLLMCLFDIDVTPRTVGYVNDIGIVSPAYTNLRSVNKSIDMSFYYYWYLMLDFDKRLLHLSKNVRNSIGIDDFGALECPLPPLKEQKDIAYYLKHKEIQLEKLIKDIKKQLVLLKEYRQSLIYEAVTGKIDVRDYPLERKEEANVY